MLSLVRCFPCRQTPQHSEAYGPGTFLFPLLEDRLASFSLHACSYTTSGDVRRWVPFCSRALRTLGVAYAQHRTTWAHWLIGGKLDLVESALRCRVTYGFNGLATQVRSETSGLVLNADSWRGWHFSEVAFGQRQHHTELSLWAPDHGCACGMSSRCLFGDWPPFPSCHSLTSGGTGKLSLMEVREGT